MAEMHDTTEEYLESILAIEEEGVVPMRARLVERLGLSAAAVSETIGRLSDHGYVELLGDRSLHLTDKGRSLATTVVRRASATPPNSSTPKNDHNSIRCVMVRDYGCAA